MPILLPAYAPPVVTPTRPQVIRARFTTSTGFVYDASGLMLSASITYGRTSQYEAAISAATCTVGFDDTQGIFDPDNTSSPLYGKLTVGPLSTTTFRVDGYVAALGGYVDLYTGVLDSLERVVDGGVWSQTTATFVDQTATLTRHIPAKNTNLPAELPGPRISRLLSTTSRSGFAWTSRALIAPLALDSGQKMLASYTCDGTTSSWDIAVNGGQVEDGLLFFDPSGVLTFHGQQRRLDSTVDWTLADDNAHVSYEPGLTFRLSTDDLIVDAAVTTADKVTSIYGPGGATQIVPQPADATSTDDTPPVTADLQENSLAAGWVTGAARARHLVAARSVPRRNAPQVTVNVLPLLLTGQWAKAGQPTGWQFAVKARISDLVLVKRTPPYGTAISELHYVEGWTHDISVDSWTTTFNLSRAVPFPTGGYWTLGVSQLGVNDTLTW